MKRLEALVVDPQGAEAREGSVTMKASRSFYRLLLRLCPPDLRREFGDEMEALFLQSLQRARGAAKVSVWARAVSDVLRHGIGARRDTWDKFRKTSAYVEYESGGWWMDTLRYDLRHAIRAMGRQPVTSLIVVMTLALAIGANTAVFSAVHTVLIRPLPYDAPDSLVMVWEKREAEGVMNNSVSAADYLDWSRTAQSFSAMAAFTEVTADLTGEGDPEKLTMAAVSSPFFDVFGSGRCLAARSSRAKTSFGRHRVVILGHGIWRQRFGGDAAVVGRSIMLNGNPYQVIGVLPANTAFPHGEAQLFMPLVLFSARRAAVAHVAQLRRLCAAAARRVVGAGAIGNGSHRQGSREAVSAIEPRARLARDVVA